MPIYRDPIDRQLLDPVASNPTDWHPATPAARNLWRCFEAMQKIGFLLVGVQGADSEVSVRRLLIQLVVPVYDFFICVRDLAQVIEGDSQARSELSPAELEYVRNLQRRYREAVLDKIEPIKAVRDKLGAHTDRAIWPSQAALLVSGLDAHMVGAYLHSALLVLDKLAQLSCYAWSTEGYGPDEVRLMNCEPFVLSFRGDGLEDFVGIEMTDSPKRHIHEKVAEIVERTTWMFPQGANRLVVKRFDSPASDGGDRSPRWS